MLYSLEEIYASGGRLPIVTLTIANDTIGTLRYVLGYEDMRLWEEDYTKVSLHGLNAGTLRQRLFRSLLRC